MHGARGEGGISRPWSSQRRLPGLTRGRRRRREGPLSGPLREGLLMAMSRDSRLPTGAVLAESERLSRTVHVGMLRRCNGAATVGGGLLHRFFDTHFI